MLTPVDCSGITSARKNNGIYNDKLDSHLLYPSTGLLSIFCEPRYDSASKKFVKE
ncbi:MAG: hypothetical protein ABRQ39_29960 [Candidatus Eremiobacterota bacterium]